jgi:hypothetical protein
MPLSEMVVDAVGTSET